MKLHRRCTYRATTEQRKTCAFIIGKLCSIPRFSDWHELVTEKEWSDVEALMAEYPQILTSTLREIAEKDVIFPPPALYFDKNSVRLAEMFSSNTTDGLKESQIENIRANYGVNLLPEPKKESVLHMIYKQLTDFMIMILIVVAIVEGSLGSWSTSIILGVVVLFNVVVGVTQEYKSNQALEALLTLSVPKATVIRGGNQSIISSSELVPGDLVVLDEGDAVPADLRLCEVSQLEIIESILTGESLGIVKSIRTIKARVFFI